MLSFKKEEKTIKTIKDKKLLALSTIVCLLPIAMYLLVYDQLPEQMIQQWGIDGTANWTMPKQWAILVTPLLLAIVHLVTVFIVSNDPKVGENPKKIQSLVIWIVPTILIFVNLAILLGNLGTNFDIGMAALSFVGLLFIIIGNYLPKTRQNYFIGIRLPWTLNDTDNWNKTHRLAGKTFILAGFLFLLGAMLLPTAGVVIALIVSSLLLIVIIPSVYSFMLYKQA